MSEDLNPAGRCSNEMIVMPVLCKFYGIVIRMLCVRELGARFHAIYEQSELVVQIKPLLGQGAREGVDPQRYSTERATKPQANFSATLRAAVLFRSDVVARSLQTHAGYARRSRLV